MKVKSYSVILILLVLCSSGTLAQYNETIITPRPGNTLGPFTLGRNVFQIQTGMVIDWQNNKNSEFSNNGVGYIASLRYGVTELFEIRSAFGIRRDVSNQNDNETVRDGLNLWNAGVRFNIKEGPKASFGFQTDVRFNFVDQDYRSNNLAPRLILLYGQKISPKIGINSNWGISWNGNNSDPRGLYAIRVGFNPTSKIRTMIETYGGLFLTDFTISFDTGVGYLVQKDLLLDMSVGYGSNDNTSSTFISLGVSWRTDTWKGNIDP